MTIEFEIPAWNEFALCGYVEAAWNNLPNAETLYQRGNYDRSLDAWSLPAQDTVWSVITGWFKDGQPDADLPWFQARGIIVKSEQTLDGIISTMKHFVAFEDIPGAGFGAAHALVTTVGPLP
jgi:hypothetical protein